jgi:DNA-binding beta-propeller fold protein YncE
LGRVIGVAVDAKWIYVTDEITQSINVFPINGANNIAPTRSIHGAATTLSAPHHIAVDASWIYVTDPNSQSIDVFPIDGANNIPPTRSIRGANTMLAHPYGIAVNDDGAVGGSATAVPTLSEWALLLLVGLTGLFGMVAKQRVNWSARP